MKEVNKILGEQLSFDLQDEKPAEQKPRPKTEWKEKKITFGEDPKIREQLLKLRVELPKAK